MRISSYMLDDFINYSGEHAITLFCKGCQLECLHCFNKDYVWKDVADAKDILDKHVNEMHTALVVLGGEPLYSKLNDLTGLLFHAKNKHGLKIKVFTNGFNPERLYNLLKAEYCGKPLVDVVSIDIKTVEGNKEIIGMLDYGQASRYVKRMMCSIQSLMDSGIPFETRTTMFPEITEYDYAKINSLVESIKLQCKTYLGHTYQEFVDIK